MAKKTVMTFSAQLMASEKQPEDPNCSIWGQVQVVDGMPTTEPAHVVLRDYNKTSPWWWAGVTIPLKKQLSYGEDYADEQPVKTDLHEVKIAKGGVFSVTTKDGAVARYRIEKVEDLAG